LKLLIFDCDGTLVDSQHKICAAMHEAYAAHGLPVPARARLLSVVGLSLTEAFAVLGEGVEGFPVGDLVDRYRAVRWGYHPPQALLDAGATFVLDEFAALVPALEGVWAGLSSSGLRKAKANHA
jgi:phosphoglycolate phosphatase